MIKASIVAYHYEFDDYKDKTAQDFLELDLSSVLPKRMLRKERFRERMPRKVRPRKPLILLPNKLQLK